MGVEPHESQPAQGVKRPSRAVSVRFNSARTAFGRLRYENLVSSLIRSELEHLRGKPTGDSALAQNAPPCRRVITEIQAYQQPNYHCSGEL